MYDDFMEGYTGRKTQKTGFQQGAQPVKFQWTGEQASKEKRKEQQEFIGTYDKSKFIRMRGPLGEQGEIYANGKMYIIASAGKKQVRTFGSRPFAIKYMQKKGWVLA